MRTLRAIPLLLLWLALPAVGSEHTPPPVQPATSFAAVETHEDEKVAIAAEPYDTREKAAIFRVDYLSHGVMPIRLIVTNNGNRPISLREARILFLTAAGDKIPGCRAGGCGAADDPQGARGRQDSAAHPAARHQAEAQGQQQGDRSRTSIPSSTARWWSSRTPRAPASCFTMSPGSTIHLRAPSCTCARCATRMARSCFISRFPSTSTSSRSPAR